MKGLYSMFLALAALVAVSESKTILIQAGPALTFTPNVTNVSPGDKVVYMTNGTHSVYESDAAKSCTFSTKPNAFKGQITPNTADGLTWTIPQNATVGSKWWYYCNVPGHCAQGMTGTLNIVAGNSTGNGTDTSGGSDNSTDNTSGSGTDSGSGTSTGSGSSGSGNGTSTGGSSSATTTTKANAANIQAVNALILVFGLLSSFLYLSF